MRRRFAWIGMAAAVLLAAGGWLGARLAPPRLRVEPPAVDLGRVRAWEMADARFRLRNAGGRALRILSVETGCGCLVPAWPRAVPGGGTEELHVRFQPQPDWNGRVEKEIVLRTADPRRPEIRLRVSADVEPLVRFEPSAALELSYRPGAVYRKEVSVRTRPGLRLGAPQPRDPRVRAKLTPAGQPGQYRLRLTLGPFPGPGDYFLNVAVPTSDPKLPRATLTVTARAAEGPVVLPRELFLPALTPGREGEEILRAVVYARGKPLRILGVETGDPAVQVEVREQERERSFELAIRYRGGWKPGVVQRTLRVRTSDPHFPVVSVPLHVTVQ